MAHSQVFLNEFPFLSSLRNLPEPKAGCAPCGAGNAEKRRVLASAKMAIAALSPGKKQMLKKMLNAEKIRLIYYVNDPASGQPGKPGTKKVEHTF